MSDYHKW